VLEVHVTPTNFLVMAEIATATWLILLVVALLIGFLIGYATRAAISAKHRHRR